MVTWTEFIAAALCVSVCRNRLATCLITHSCSCFSGFVCFLEFGYCGTVFVDVLIEMRRSLWL